MKRTVLIALAACTAGLSLPAQAIPSFARKYGTSCQTCHTIFPKLTPFGEAFRRNGFRFPGVDSDYWKQDQITLQPKTASSDGSTLSAIPPLSFGANGQAVIHPDHTATGAGDNGSHFLFNALVAEGHLWAGGSMTDKITYFGEVTAGSDGTVDVEHLQVYFNDLVGPQHAVNLRVGRGFNDLSSFGMHSSYLADARGVSLAVAGLQGGTPSWNPLDHYNGLQLEGVLGGRVDYSLGLNAGMPGPVVRDSENVYGHLGYKIGGLRLDGEGKGTANPARPWEETAITFEAFAYHAYGSVQFAGTDEAGAATSLVQDDTTNGGGGGLRAQWGSLELNSGISYEHHSRVTPDFAAGTAGSATAISHYDELSYVVAPWLVPAVRFEYFSLSPDGGQTQSLYRILPGVAMTAVPNLKLTVVAVIEGATGNPPGGWGPVGATVTPPDLVTSQSAELEAVTFTAAIAF